MSSHLRNFSVHTVVPQERCRIRKAAGLLTAAPPFPGGARRFYLGAAFNRRPMGLYVDESRGGIPDLTAILDHVPALPFAVNGDGGAVGQIGNDSPR